MKNKLLQVIVLGFAFALISCGNPPPDQLLARVVLNANLLYGFAGAGMQRDFTSPSVKLVDEKSGATAPMKRAELLQTKLETVETNFAKVKALRSTDDNKEMLNAALALYEFVLPVYKNEYAQLARLYDDGAPAEQIAAMEKSIQEKYGAKFEELYAAVGATGKAYAAKHNIPLKEVNPAPPKIN